MLSDIAVQADDLEQDRGEVKAGDIVDYWLEVNYTAYGSQKSGVVTFTDVLPEHMELVTGTQSVAGSQKDTTPVLDTTSGATWGYSNSINTAVQDSGDFTYDSSTREFKGYIKDMQATGDDSNPANAKLHIWARVVDDAITLTKKGNNTELLYYVNYFTAGYANATSISNKVQFHSGNPDAGVYTVEYRYTGDVPAGLTPPVSAQYSKGATISVAPNPTYKGYKFLGWELQSQDASVVYDKNASTLTVSKASTITNIVLAGTWTIDDSKFELNYSWQGKLSNDITGEDSSDDTPTDISVPESSEIAAGGSVEIPKFPEIGKTTDSSSAQDPYKSSYDKYSFLGWIVKITETGGNPRIYELTDLEKSVGSFIPKSASNAEISKVELVGCWTKKEFTVTFSMETGETAPDGFVVPSAIKSKWGKDVTLPIPSINHSNPDDNKYEFRGYTFDASVTAKNANDGIYVMPSQDISAFISFDTYYRLKIDGGYQSTSVNNSSTSEDDYQYVKGSDTVLITARDQNQIEFSSFSYDANSLDSNFVKNDEDSLSFKMPNSKFEVTLNYFAPLIFNVINGNFVDNALPGVNKGEVSAVVNIPMVKQSDSSWKGNILDSNIPQESSMEPISAYKSDNATWTHEEGDVNPNDYVGTGTFLADSSGNMTTPYSFRYFFFTENTITIHYSSSNSNWGSVSNLVDGPFNALNGTPKGSTASNVEGYKFVGWYRTINGSTDFDNMISGSKTFVPSSEYVSSSTDEVYVECDYVARFEPNSYFIKYHGNGSDAGEMADQEIRVGERTKLTRNAFTKDKFEFGGWTTKDDHTGDYYCDEEGVLDLSKDDGAIFNLYAKWIENKGEVVPVDPDNPNNGSLTGYANNIRISIEQAKELEGKTDVTTLSTLVDLSNAYFVLSMQDMRAQLVDVATVEQNNIKGSVGSYTVKLSSASAQNITASVEFSVFVYDKVEPSTPGDNNIKIAANNFTVSANEVKDKHLSDGTNEQARSEILRLSNAFAWNSLTKDEVEINMVDSTIKTDDNMLGIKGVYDVTLKVLNNDVPVASITIQATVTDYASEVADIRLTAHDFVLKTDEVAGIDDDKLVSSANARAVLVNDGSSVDVSVDKSSEQKTNLLPKRGKYIVTFYAESAPGLKDGPEVTVNVLVADNVIEDEDSGHVIYGNDFSIGYKYVSSLDSNKIIRLANAGAYDIKSGANLPLNVNKDVIEAKRGTYYPVSFSTDKANLNVSCVVTDESTEPSGDGGDEDSKYQLSANNFTVSIDDAQTIIAMADAARKLELVQRAFARAVLIETGEYVDFTAVDSSRLQAISGSYSITYILDDKNSITVTCTVGGTIEPDIPTGPDASHKVAISARDFAIGLEQAIRLSLNEDSANDALIELASARAWKIEDHSSVQISDVLNTIELKRGSYDVTFAAVLFELNSAGEKEEVDSVSVTIKASISDRQVDPNPDRPDPEPDNPNPKPDPSNPDFVNIEAFANDFVVSIDEVVKENLDDGTKSFATLVKLGGVSARTIIEQTPVDIISATSTIRPAKGNYLVTYTTDEVEGKSMSITSSVRVADKGGSSVDDDPDRRSAERILANNFALSRAEADAIARGDIYTGSNVQRAYAVAPLNEGQKELIRLSSAYAYRVADGYQIDITHVDFNYSGELGVSEVVFATERGTSVSVSATVTSSSSESIANGERIVANDVAYTFDEANMLLSKSNDEIATQLKDDAGAFAYSTIDGAVVDVVKATWDIEAKGGQYEVTFETLKGTSVTVNASVENSPLTSSLLSKTGDNLFGLICVLVVFILISFMFINNRRAGKLSNRKH